MNQWEISLGLYLIFKNYKNCKRSQKNCEKLYSEFRLTLF